MKTNFCDQIDNIQRLLKACRRLRARSVDEVCFLVVEGRQGYGKTHAIHWWATRHGCPYVRSSTTWTPRRMLQALLRHLGCPHPTGDAGAAWLVRPSCWLRRGHAQRGRARTMHSSSTRPTS